MNFLAGGLLIFCTEELSFWMLTFIVDKMLAEYNSESMAGSIADWYLENYFFFLEM